MAKIKVRRAKYQDVPQLVDRLVEFYSGLAQKGAKDIETREAVLRGGVVAEVGTGIDNPHWHCIVAVKDLEVVGFMIGILQPCSPIQSDFRCVRIHAMFLDNDSLAAPKILKSMWGLMDSWSKENGAGHYYANIHPGNQPSVRAAKSIGFKHHYTQFYLTVEDERVDTISSPTENGES